MTTFCTVCCPFHYHGCLHLHWKKKKLLCVRLVFCQYACANLKAGQWVTFPKFNWRWLLSGGIASILLNFFSPLMLGPDLHLSNSSLALSLCNETAGWVKPLTSRFLSSCKLAILQECRMVLLNTLSWPCLKINFLVIAPAHVALDKCYNTQERPC